VHWSRHRTSLTYDEYLHPNVAEAAHSGRIAEVAHARAAAGIAFL
jgi:hypothetical protein